MSAHIKSMKQLLLAILASIAPQFCLAEPEGAPAFPEIGKVYSVTWVAADTQGKPPMMKLTKFLGGTWYSAEVFDFRKEPKKVIPLGLA